MFGEISPSIFNMMPIDNYSRNICIAIHTKCNLNCVYCYETKKSTSAFDVKETLYDISEVLNTETQNGTKIKLHGGEPFLEFEKIKAFCEGLWSVYRKEKYKIHITTNGTLVHSEIAEWISQNKNRLILKLSIDGAKLSHNMNRSNSFDQIDLDFFIKNFPDIRINMTITPQTIPFLSENIKYLYSVGFKYINSNFALLRNWENSKLEKIFYQQLMILSKYYISNNHVTPISLLSGDLKRLLFNNVFYSPCNVGNKNAYDFETKELYPCHLFFPSICGFNNSKIAKQIDFKDRSQLESDTCINCKLLNLCKTCYAENLIKRGSVKERDMDYCNFHKIAIYWQSVIEYYKIIRQKSFTKNDYEKMLAIKLIQKEIGHLKNIYE